MREPQRRTGLPRFGQPRRRGRVRRDPLPPSLATGLRASLRPSLRPSLGPGPARPDPVALRRWPGTRRGSVIPWASVASLLAHLAVVALLLWQGQGGRMEEPQASPPAVDVVFESGQPEPRATGAREGEDPSAEEPPSRAEAPPPAPEAPPMPVAPPAPPPVAAALPTLPAPPTPTPPVAALPQPPAPPVVAQVIAPPRPPEPAAADPPQRPIEPEPRLSAEVPPPTPLPGPLAPQTPLELAQPRVEPLPSPSPTPPVPPAVTPAVSRRPAPRPQQQAQPAPRLPGLYLPDGPSFSAPRPRPGRLEGQRPQFDLAVSPRLLEGRTSPDPSVQVRGAQVGPNWNAAFRRWLDQNLQYPIRAIEEGDSGTVRVQITARPDGTVTGVRLTGASTSPWLNSGTTRPFPGARLPPFPPGADPSVEVDLTVQYILIRR